MNAPMDLEVLIEAVKQHPIIWDYKTSDHKDKIKKHFAWINVARIVDENYDTRSEKLQKLKLQAMQSKWKSLRDNLSRSHRRNAYRRRCGLWKTKEYKQYVYAKQLAFLNKFLDIPPQDRIYDTPKPEKETFTKIPKNLKKPSMDELLFHFPESSVSNGQSDKKDDDTSFFDSLLPDVKKFNRSQKMRFRIAALQLIQNISGTECKCGDIDIF